MFGDVNLIVGANGTGKTSLLEAIEVLYCGRVRRDPEAAFQNIVGEVENERGGLETVKATTTTATLKARNTTWYGRTDMQANAISQGFTRFNFLDTDAAFRLSSEDSNEQIKHDLGRLLVGPETSKLWTYLSKLADEVGGRLKSLDDRLPSERRNVELLADEVRRLREAPSEANTLLKAFRSGVAQLNPRWGDPDQGSALAPGERTRLETLSRSIAQVLSAISDTPVTREKIQQRVAHMQGVVGSAKKIQVEHDAAVKQATEAANRTKESLALQTQLEQWAKLVEADVPALAGKLREAEARTGHLRAVLRDQSADSPPDVPAEYAELPIQEGLAIAGLKLKEAQEQDRIAATALSQGMQLGQTLEMLRRDLHDASVTYLERSGEATLCPVCKTPHPANELLAKIEALVRSDSSQVSDSLRRNVQNARERLEQARVAVTQLSALDTFRQASGASAMSTATQLHLGLRHAREELRSLTSDVQSYQTALAQLNLVGLQWSSWQQMRDAVAIPLLPLSADPIDLSAVKLALDGMKERAQTDADTQAKALDSVSELVRQAVDLASNELSVPATNLGPAQVVTSMERRLQQAELAASTVDALAATIPLDADTALEAVQSGVEASLLEYDKALHALQGDELAKTVLKKKDEELQSATQTLTTNSTARTNLARAREVLSTLVTDHSLDKATADAFNAIRGNVSSVFAQIHSPPEYELGNLNEGELIIRRDNKQRHAANQVSSGQRAALALSIFLALNDSAKTAPPVILIDDPVAHIDDLNALSFLDYLREVVVGGRKQVFFATADVRLAALFQRKFEFLGSKRFKRITLPLDEAILA